MEPQLGQKQPIAIDSVHRWFVHGNRHWLGLAMLLAAVASLNLATLLRLPAPFVDEAWYAARAWEFSRSGRVWSTLDSGVADRFDGYWTFLPWLGTWFQSLTLRVLGLSLFSARLTSLVFGIVLLVVVYVIAKELFDRRIALLSVFITSTSQSFLASSHLARQDIIVATFGFVAVALYLVDRAPGFSFKSILSGLAVGLAFEIHPPGMIYGPAIVGLYLLDYGPGVLRARRFWGFALGVFMGLCFYAAMHVLPYPNTYFALAKPLAGDWRPPPILILDTAVWVESGLALLALLFWSSYMEVFIVLGACVFMLRRRSDPDKRLLVLFATLASASWAMFRYKPQYYGILLLPVTSLTVAALLDEVSCWLWKAHVRRRFAAALLWGIVAGSIVYGLLPIQMDPMEDYEATLDAVRQSIPLGSSILGPQTYWFAVPNERYLVWEQISGYQRFVPGSSTEDALRALEPDFLIIDRHSEMFVAYDKARVSSILQYLYVSKADLDRFLGRQGHLVGRMKTPTFGDVRIYKIDWY